LLRRVFQQDAELSSEIHLHVRQYAIQKDEIRWGQQLVRAGLRHDGIPVVCGGSWDIRTQFVSWMRYLTTSDQLRLKPAKDRRTNALGTRNCIADREPSSQGEEEATKEKNEATSEPTDRAERQVEETQKVTEAFQCKEQFQPSMYQWLTQDTDGCDSVEASLPLDVAASSDGALTQTDE